MDVGSLPTKIGRAKCVVSSLCNTLSETL